MLLTRDLSEGMMAPEGTFCSHTKDQALRTHHVTRPRMRGRPAQSWLWPPRVPSGHRLLSFCCLVCPGSRGQWGHTPGLGLGRLGQDGGSGCAGTLFTVLS